MSKLNHTPDRKIADTKAGQRSGQTFSLIAPQARSVQLVGDFTGWEQQPIDLRKGKKGAWRAVVELPPGQHQYRFLVDGEWRDDPDCAAQVPNPFGGQNAVRTVSYPFHESPGSSNHHSG